MKKTYFLSGLNCPVCAQKLERAAQRLKGVDKAKVNFGSGSLALELNPEGFIEDELNDLLKNLGLETDSTLP